LLWVESAADILDWGQPARPLTGFTVFCNGGAALQCTLRQVWCYQLGGDDWCGLSQLLWCWHARDADFIAEGCRYAVKARWGPWGARLALGGAQGRRPGPCCWWAKWGAGGQGLMVAGGSKGWALLDGKHVVAGR
jgi:hypothetical protein